MTPAGGRKAAAQRRPRLPTKAFMIKGLNKRPVPSSGGPLSVRPRYHAPNPPASDARPDALATRLYCTHPRAKYVLSMQYVTVIREIKTLSAHAPPESGKLLGFSIYVAEFKGYSGQHGVSGQSGELAGSKLPRML